MNRLIAVAFVCLATSVLAQGPPAQRAVAIVTDDPQAAAVLAEGLRAAENIVSEVVAPAQFSAERGYRAIIVLLDGAVPAPLVRPIETLVSGGGRLVLLSRAIDPARNSAEWLRFIGVKPSSGASSRYRVAQNVPVDLVGLTHRHFVIENKVAYTSKVMYRSSSREREMALPALAFPATTALLNVEPARLKHYLLGARVASSGGAIQMQDAGAWVEDVGTGQIFFFMPGDTINDFKVSAFIQMIANAIIQP